MTNPNDFINPSTHQNQDGTHDFNVNKGLTKLEYFSVMAMQGILSNNRMIDTNEWDWLGRQSVKAAYSIIEALNDK